MDAILFLLFLFSLPIAMGVMVYKLIVTLGEANMKRHELQMLQRGIDVKPYYEKGKRDKK